jgi:hypothetical protein
MPRYECISEWTRRLVGEANRDCIRRSKIKLSPFVWFWSNSDLHPLISFEHNQGPPLDALPALDLWCRERVLPDLQQYSISSADPNCNCYLWRRFLRCPTKTSQGAKSGECGGCECGAIRKKLSSQNATLLHHKKSIIGDDGFCASHFPSIGWFCNRNSIRE